MSEYRANLDASSMKTENLNFGHCDDGMRLSAEIEYYCFFTAMPAIYQLQLTRVRGKTFEILLGQRNKELFTSPELALPAVCWQG